MGGPFEEPSLNLSILQCCDVRGVIGFINTADVIFLLYEKRIYFIILDNFIYINIRVTLIRMEGRYYITLNKYIIYTDICNPNSNASTGVEMTEIGFGSCPIFYFWIS